MTARFIASVEMAENSSPRFGAGSKKKRSWSSKKKTSIDSPRLDSPLQQTASKGEQNDEVRKLIATVALFRSS